MPTPDQYRRMVCANIATDMFWRMRISAFVVKKILECLVIECYNEVPLLKEVIASIEFIKRQSTGGDVSGRRNALLALEKALYRDNQDEIDSRRRAGIW